LKGSSLTSGLQERGGEERRREGEQVECDEEELVQGAAHKQDVAVVVVQVHDLAPLCINVLVALAAATHGESGIHVHVMAGEVETDEELEDHAPARHSGRKEDKEAGGGAAICHHVQDSSELCGLVEGTGSVAIESIQKARDAVEEGACARMKGHVVERAQSEEDTSVAWVSCQLWDVQTSS